MSNVSILFATSKMFLLDFLNISAIASSKSVICEVPSTKNKITSASSKAMCICLFISFSKISSELFMYPPVSTTVKIFPCHSQVP